MSTRTRPVLFVSSLVFAAAAAFLALPGGREAHAMDYGLVHAACVPVESSIFQKEVIGDGSSCALIGRVTAAHNNAAAEVSADAAAECDAIFDSAPGFYEAYCSAVCTYNGFDHSTVGVFACETTITDEDTFASGSCTFGQRQFSVLTADVACGCKCHDDLVSPP